MMSVEYDNYGNITLQTTLMTYDLSYAFFGTIVMGTIVTGGVGIIPSLLVAGGLAVGGYFVHRYAEKDSYSSYWELGW